MDSFLQSALIAEAKMHLAENPQDSLHDLAHHARVVELATAIVKAEDLMQTANNAVVELIGWWHDVRLDSVAHDPSLRIAEETALYLSKKLPESLQHIVFDSIKNHEFGLQPHYLEGKVLQDADKLEVLSVVRAEKVVPMVKSGESTKEAMLKILEMVTEHWLPAMLNRYHFDFSREFHLQHVAAAITKWEEIRVELEEM